MILKNIIFTIVFILLSKNIYGSEQSINPMIVSDLAKMKATSERAHAKRSALSDETILEHNALATEVNGFIDGTIMCIKDNKVDNHDIRQRVSTLNHKMSAFVQNLKKPQKSFNRDDTFSMEKHFDVQKNALLGRIGTVVVV